MSQQSALAKSIRDFKAARDHMNSTLADSVSRLGFHPQDIADAEGTLHQVRAARDMKLTIGPRDAYLVGGNPSGELDPTSVVALVASNSQVGAPLWHGYGIYLRDHSLKKPVRHIAAALGTDVDHHVPEIRPILARFFLGSAAAVPQHPSDPVINQRLSAVRPLLASTAVRAQWPAPCDLFILGDPIPLRLPLGYDRPTGLPGTQHHRLGDLRAATALKGTPTVRW